MAPATRPMEAPKIRPSAALPVPQTINAPTRPRPAPRTIPAPVHPIRRRLGGLTPTVSRCSHTYRGDIAGDEPTGRA